MRAENGASGTTVIHPDMKRLDAKTRTDFKEQATAFVLPGAKLVLDLSGVEFIDSSGLGILLTLLRQLDENGGDLRIAAPSRVVAALFKMTRMNRVFEIFPDIAAAVASFTPLK